MIVLVAGPTVWAADRYVATNGVDSGNCGIGLPCGTLPYAIGRMADGDTLFVDDGTYSAGTVQGTGCRTPDISTHILLDGTTG